MGGMFSVVKVRKDQKRGDYSDPGWFQHPPASVAYEWTGALAEPARSAPAAPATGASATAPVELKVRKPGGTGHRGHNGH
jgi:hypothetical protein